VMHNGLVALSGSHELCRHLFEDRRKKLVILSNTSAPSHKALEKLVKLGFNAHHFIGVVTSGDEAARFIREQLAASTKSKALMFTWDASKPDNPRLTAMPQDFLDLCGRNVEVATSVDDADWILLHGSEVWHTGSDRPDQRLGSFIEDGSFDAIDPILRQCLKRNLPLVCANPDFVVQTPTGGTAYMPGRIAQRYAELAREENRDVRIHVFGKPNAEHFEACLHMLDLPARRVAHVGDSLDHDVAGATAAGIDSVWITSGIHQKALQTSFGELPDLESLQNVMQQAGGIVPTHVVPAFRL